MTFDSDALKANLAETAVDEVIIEPSLNILLEIVQDYRGIHSTLHELLTEICHPYRNWKLILPKLRTFTLKNTSLFARSSQGSLAFLRFTDLYFIALEENQKYPDLAAQAMEGLLAYVERVVATVDDDLIAYEDVIAEICNHLASLDTDILMYLVQGQHPMKKISRSLLDYHKRKKQFNLEPVINLMKRVLSLNYHYWLEIEDPQPWFLKECQDMCRDWEAGNLFNNISHNRIREHLEQLDKIESGSSDHTEILEKILELPGHMDIVRYYKEIPAKLTSGEQVDADEVPDEFGENRRLIFLFRIMRTPGLYLIHEDSLREINRSLVKLIHRQSYEEIHSFLLTTLKLLQDNISRYPHTALQCIQVIGTEVFKRENSRLVETFLWETVRFGFQYAEISGVDEDWQPLVNPAHLTNIRVWLNLIMQEPKWCATLFSALIINLKLTGTCIKDTDLFQKDISRLLNHPVKPVYNLVKQFTKLMPVFFNDIGAEGDLRDVSTEVDEIHDRKDVLIHFLRKQSHVESSNLIVGFLEAIIRFWYSRDKKGLEYYLPDHILSQVRTEGEFIDDIHRLTVAVFEKGSLHKPADLLDLEEDRLERFLRDQQDIPHYEKERFRLMVKMYRLLDLKYNLGYQELRHQLGQAAVSGFPEMEDLLVSLESCETMDCLDKLLENLEHLKEIILSPQVFEAKEEIYHKRHIAVDIPSVYGRYSERKFDALGLTFRLEKMANIYLEKLPSTVNLTFITRATFIRILKCLRLYLRALKIDGITSRRLETYVSLLSNSLGIKRFSYTQYLDIFRGLSEGVKDVIYAYYNNIHQNNLSIIIPQIGPHNLLPKYRSLVQRDKDSDNYPREDIHRLSEAFMRDLISQTFGLQHLDNFISKIYHVLERQKEMLDEDMLDLLMTYNPEKVILFLDRKSPHYRNLILLGNKGYNLSVLACDQKPVPPGFIVTTEIFRCWEVINNFFLARNEFLNQVRQALNIIEEKTGLVYGDQEKPLLISVRSGAAISMPGMMATVHNVGLNEEIAREFARSSGKAYLAWDNFRRYIQSWAMAQGVEREFFQALMDEAKERHGVKVKGEFTSEQMEELALNYRNKVSQLGISIPQDPWVQLSAAIEKVLTSWNTQKSREYRRLMGISDYWGTAVIVQAMVFGNLSRQSGSGVVFTAHPYRQVRRVALWGDYAAGDQGEDIVGGLVTTHPISVEQAEIDGRSVDMSLERQAPEVYQELRSIARNLVYEKEWNPQEIEFTFEGPRAEDLYVLQTRDMYTIKQKEKFQVFTDEEILKTHVLGSGIGVSGSALSGLAVFNDNNVEELKEKYPETPLILIRQDTVPEDINIISRVDGLLTARGGQTSHASVVTLRLGKTCVVGCKALTVYESEEKGIINDHTIKSGDEISIDGRQGLILSGTHEVREEVHILPM
ncbi:MAG: PEP/pyruvate-binding domain-containing protein [Desulfurivibrionaceae bacterium]